MLIFATAVVAWADHTAPLLLGLSASWLPWHQENGAAGSVSSFLGRSPMHTVTLQEALTLLPSSMPILLQKEPWKEQTQKVRLAATCPDGHFPSSHSYCRIEVGGSVNRASHHGFSCSASETEANCWLKTTKTTAITCLQLEVRQREELRFAFSY